MEQLSMTMREEWATGQFASGALQDKILEVVR